MQLSQGIRTLDVYYIIKFSIRDIFTTPYLINHTPMITFDFKLSYLHRLAKKLVLIVQECLACLCCLTCIMTVWMELMNKSKPDCTLLGQTIVNMAQFRDGTGTEWNIQDCPGFSSIHLVTMHHEHLMWMYVGEGTWTIFRNFKLVSGPCIGLFFYQTEMNDHSQLI